MVCVCVCARGRMAIVRECADVFVFLVYVSEVEGDTQQGLLTLNLMTQYNTLNTGTWRDHFNVFFQHKLIIVDVYKRQVHTQLIAIQRSGSCMWVT